MDMFQLLSGYSYRDEYVARDIMILELLCKKGLISDEEVAEMFTQDNLSKYIALVQKETERIMHDTVQRSQDAE